MKSGLAVVMAIVVGGSAAYGGTLEKTAAWAKQAGEVGVERSLRGWGIKDPATVAALRESWDEDLLVDAALAARAYGLLAWAERSDGLSEASGRKIYDVLRTETNAPSAVLDVVRAVPVELRAELEPMLQELIGGRYPGQPVFGAHVVKYALVRDIPVFSVEVEIADLVKLLLASEPVQMTHAAQVKNVIRAAAVNLVKSKLRAEGKSFVVQDGVNPLAEGIRPVVDALNAPGCSGLEAALRGLGGEVQDVDRTELDALAGVWRSAIMAGELYGGEMNKVLGKLAVALGVDGFNAFVDHYNNGTGSPEHDGQ
jgi:hypothetical protein